jgi:tRNA (guanine-N7-)-methyltransferase
VKQCSVAVRCKGGVVLPLRAAKREKNPLLLHCLTALLHWQLREFRRSRPISREWPEEQFLVKPGANLRGPGEWESVFGRSGGLSVEIGFGKDEFLLELAGARPEGLFLGVDFSRPRTRSYLRKIALRGLRNVRVLFEHAANAVGYCLGDASVSELFVLFPDPWPKERHARNRLVRPWFAREAARVLVPGGRFTLATDHPPYRDQMLTVIESGGAFANIRGPKAYGNRPRGFSETIFERRWIEQGREVFYLQYSRNAP